MRLIQHVSCDNSAPAAAVNAGIAQDPARGAEAGAGGCTHRGHAATPGAPVVLEPCAIVQRVVNVCVCAQPSCGELGVLVNHAGALEESCR